MVNSGCSVNGEECYVYTSNETRRKVRAFVGGGYPDCGTFYYDTLYYFYLNTNALETFHASTSSGTFSVNSRGHCIEVKVPLLPGAGARSAIMINSCVHSITRKGQAQSCACNEN
jgi:hypothetical protein